MFNDEFQSWLHHRLGQPLPGLDAQLRMASLNRNMKYRNFKVPDDARQSAVLLLLYPGEQNNIILPMQERTAYKGVHSRQIGLPGGGVEDFDTDYEDTALRETREELGVERETVKVLGRLSKIYIPPSNYIVQPIVGIARQRPNFVLDPVEVKSLLEAPIEAFTAKDAVQTAMVKGRNFAEMEVPCFRVHGHVVWGATAMIMSEFGEIMSEFHS